MAMIGDDDADLYVSDADRNAVIERLREHIGAGRLSLDEFEVRAAEAYAALTVTELEHALRRLPARVGGADANLPRRHRTRIRNELAAWFATNSVCIGIWSLTPRAPFWPIIPLVLTTVGFIAMLIRGAEAEDERRRAKARKQGTKPAAALSAPLPRSRSLITVLYVDLVASTTLAAALGDRRWRELLDRYEAVIVRCAAAFGGRLIKMIGDGALVTFEVPADAVRAAAATRAAVTDLGIETRSGVHVGEVEIRDDDIAGIAAHIGQRVTALAAPGEILVSRTVADLVSGSGLVFRDRGIHELRGVPGTWQLLALADQ